MTISESLFLFSSDTTCRRQFECGAMSRSSDHGLSTSANNGYHVASGSNCFKMCEPNAMKNATMALGVSSIPVGY